MKEFVVRFVVQAADHHDAIKQARAYLNTGVREIDHDVVIDPPACEDDPVPAPYVYVAE